MPNGKLKKGGIKVIVGYLLTPVIQAAVLFGCAGRMDLPWLWVCLGVSFVGIFGFYITWAVIGLDIGRYQWSDSGLIAAAVLVIRTALEDRTLQKELEGYVEYTEKTRYRLLPGIW